MASGLYVASKDKIVSQSIDIVAGAAIKLMLVQDTYTFDETEEFVDDGIANDLASHELSVTGYTGGFGGAGRRVPSNRNTQQSGSVVEYHFDNETWTELASGETIGGVALIKEVSADTDSPAIAWDELGSDVPTNGGDVTYKPNDNAGTSGKMFDW